MLDKIDCPVLVAWGEQDPWTPLNGSVGKFFQRQVAKRDNLKLVTLPDTGISFCICSAFPDVWKILYISCRPQHASFHPVQCFFLSLLRGIACEVVCH